MSALDTITDALNKFVNIDRRVWYVLLVVLVSIPLLHPLGLPIQIEDRTQAGYDYIKNLPAGASVVFTSTSANLVPEQGPAMVAIMKMLFALPQKVKILFVTDFSTGSQDVSRLVDTYYLPQVAASAKYGQYYTKAVYGVDYLIAPFLSLGTAGMSAFASDASKVFTGVKDYRGVGYMMDFPIMQYFLRATQYNVYIISGGEPNFMTEVQVYNAPYGVKFFEIAQSMHWALHMPYYTAGQSIGMTNGLKGGAELELLIGEPTAFGVGGIDAFSVTYSALWIILILSNVGWYLQKRRAMK